MWLSPESISLFFSHHVGNLPVQGHSGGEGPDGPTLMCAPFVQYVVTVGCWIVSPVVGMLQKPETPVS